MIIYQIHLSEHYSNLTILLLARIASNNMSEVTNLAIDLGTSVVVTAELARNGTTSIVASFLALYNLKNQRLSDT